MKTRIPCAVLIAILGSVGSASGQSKGPAPTPQGLPAAGAGQATGGSPVPVAVAVRPSSSDVTFTMPLNLTNLSPLISKVAVQCTIRSTALPQSRAAGQVGSVSSQQEYSVASGRVVTTATIVVPVAAVDTSQPNGKTAEYDCVLMFYSERLQQWNAEDELDPKARALLQTGDEFKLTPQVGRLNGSFNW